MQMISKLVKYIEIIIGNEKRRYVYKVSDEFESKEFRSMLMGKQCNI